MAVDEPHLETIVARIRHDFEVDAVLGAPQVAYRETIASAVEVQYTHSKHLGPVWQFASVKLRLSPLPSGSGFVFANSSEGEVPEEYMPGVERGLRTSVETGPLAGFPMIDLRAELIGGAYHDVDSSVVAFEIAARKAFEEGITKASPRLLEPIMLVEVKTPEWCLGEIIGDLHLRRAVVIDMQSSDDERTCGAIVPLANMFGYAGSLRSISRGLAEFRMRFDKYEIVPPIVDPPDDFPPAVGMRP